MRALAAVMSIVFVSMAFQSGHGPLTLVRTIALPGVEGRFDHFAIDNTGQRLFVAALGNGSVEVIDLKEGRHSRSLPGFREPQGIAFLPDLKLVVVAEGQGVGAQIIDAADYQRIGTVKLGEDADNVRYDAANKRVFVGYGSGAVAAVDPATRTVLADARLSGHPESFQLERSGSRIFVNVPTAEQIAIVDRKVMRVTTTWPVTTARANFPMALDEEGRRLFVGCRRPAKLLVYDTTTGKEIASFDIVGDTDDLWYDVARKRLYISGGEGFLDVFQEQDANHFSRLAHIATAAGARTSLFSLEQNALYLAVPHRGGQVAEVRIYELH